MEDKLYFQSEIVRLLQIKGDAKFGIVPFSEAVKRGQIPYTTNKKGRKFFDYDEVVKALKVGGIGGVYEGKRQSKATDKEIPKTYKKGNSGERPKAKAKKKKGTTESRKTAKDILENLPSPKENETVEEYKMTLGEAPTITDVGIYKTLYQGKLEKMKYEKEKGLLISREEVEDKAFSVARAIRDKILSIPERMSNELASIEDPYTIKEMLYKEFMIALTELGKLQ